MPLIESILNLTHIAAVVAIALIIAYGVLLARLLRERAQRGEMNPWLFVLAVASLVSLIPYIVSTLLSEAISLPDNLTLPALTIYLMAFAMLIFSRLSLNFLRDHIPPLLTLLAVLWFGALLYAGFTATDPTPGAPGWHSSILEGSLPGLLAGCGWVGLFIAHMVLSVRAYSKAHLPELANRMLFWVVIVPLFFLSIALGTSGVQPWAMIGWVVQFLSVVGATYGIVLHRLFDVRRAAQQAVRFWMFTIVASLAILGVLLALEMRIAPPSFVELGLFALVTGLAAVLLGRVTDWLANYALGQTLDPTRAIQQYSQEIVVEIDLYQLVMRMVDTLRQVLNVKRGMLILTQTQDGTVLLEPFSTSDVMEDGAALSIDSPIYQTLYGDRSVLLQYDLEYQNRFDKASSKERDFFKSLQMNAYAPIIVGEELIGVVASGPKIGDAPFYPQELSLLAAIANQTGIALRNARLVADLRAREAEMMRLNQNINAANTQLARLDSVKSDFITIASHELRTPLAQIRGYTDIIDAFNEQGTLETFVMADMIAKMRKATGRLEVLISDMLDVSQLDVNAMDLRFVETKPVSIIRMAIEPLTDAIKERNLSLAARGLGALPAMRADLERLVQAFRNIIVNAIKYTPDGGSIEIVGQIHAVDENSHPGEIRISISDTGVGIQEEHQELIFEKFFRGADPSLHSTGSTKFMGAGPGLGLTIARGVIEGHGGRIWCESPGFDLENFPGSTFYVILPVEPPEDASRVLPFEKTNEATPSPVP